MPKDLIIFVCQANYCRSPVAEVIAKNIFLNNYEFESYGISPYPDSNMDSRSRCFLDKNGYKHLQHTPRRINKSKIFSSLIIFALDLRVLDTLNKMFPKSKNKIKILNYKDKSINLSDPFRYNDSDYEMIMKNIEYVIKNNFDIK